MLRIRYILASFMFKSSSCKYLHWLIVQQWVVTLKKKKQKQITDCFNFAKKLILDIEDQKQTKNKYSGYILLYIDQLFLFPYVKSSKNLHIWFSVMFIIQNMGWGGGGEWFEQAESREKYTVALSFGFIF